MGLYTGQEGRAENRWVMESEISKNAGKEGRQGCSKGMWQHPESISESRVRVSKEMFCSIIMMT